MGVSKRLSEEMMPLISRLGLPLTAVKAIAQKAEEILKTNCAIVGAPDHCKEARMVISHECKGRYFKKDGFPHDLSLCSIKNGTLSLLQNLQPPNIAMAMYIITAIHLVL